MLKTMTLPSAALMTLVFLSACSAAGAAALNQAPAEAPRAQAYDASRSDRIASSVSCDIRIVRTAHGVMVQPVASARADFTGEYNLELTTSGGGNSSTISQGGPVSLNAGSLATLGENEVSLNRGSHLHAVLTVRDAHGELCRKVVNL